MTREQAARARAEAELDQHTTLHMAVAPCRPCKVARDLIDALAVLSVVSAYLSHAARPRDVEASMRKFMGWDAPEGKEAIHREEA